MKPLHLLIALAWAGVVWPILAQTTQPAPPEWDQTVQAIAKVMTSGDSSSAPQVSDNNTIRSFDGSAKQWPDLIAHTGGATLLSAKSYIFPYDGIAADIAAAIKGSNVSDDIKKTLVPPDGDPTEKANATASRWAQNELTLASEEPFAVLVFLAPDPNHPDSGDGLILFVLLKGQKDSSGAYAVSQIVFGNSQQAAVVSAR